MCVFVVDQRYGIDKNYLPTVKKTLSVAIARHEADKKAFEAEASKVSLLLIPCLCCPIRVTKKEKILSLKLFSESHQELDFFTTSCNDI